MRYVFSLCISLFWIATVLSAAKPVHCVSNLDDPLLPHRRAKIPVTALVPDASTATLYQVPTPRWVTSLSLSTPPKATGEDMQMLLVEKQLNVDSETTYHRIVKRVLTDKGIHDHGLVALTYDPAFQKVTLHSLCLYRRHEKIDQAPTANFHLVEAKDHDADPSRGRRWSLITLLHDVREGDIIEYSYTAQGHNPSFMERTVDECAFQYPYPVERVYYRVMGALPCHVHLKAHHTQLQPERQQLGQDQWEWVWNATHIPAYQVETHQPSWYQTAPWVQISEFSDWNDVARWGANLFRTSNEASQPLVALTTEWQQRYPTESERALAALRYVQDEIAFIAEETSELHYPTDLTTLLKQRKADSVDKAYLYKSLLEMMHIAATPAAVSTQHRHTIADWLPSPSAFDRVIVRVQADGSVYWVDPSFSPQGGSLANSSCGMYKRALLLEPTARELICLGCSLAEPEVIAETTYYLWPNKLESTVLVNTTLTGATADLLRGRLQEEGREAVLDSLRNAYITLYGELVSVQPAQIEDNRQENRLNILEHYRIKNLWQISDQGQVKSMAVRPVYISARLPLVEQQDRKTPIALDYPTHISETLHIVAPGHEWLQEAEAKHFITNSIDCQVSREISGDTMTLHGVLKILKDHVALDELPDYQASTIAILEAPTSIINLPTEHHHPWDVTWPLLTVLYLSVAIAFLAIDLNKN